MQANYTTGHWFCFGCNLKGDALAFVRSMEKTDDLGACKKLVKILRSKSVAKVEPKPTAIIEKDGSKQSLVEASDYYYGLRSVDWNNVGEEEEEVKQYMLGRGFTEESLNKSHAKYTYNYSYPIIFPMLDNGEFRGWVCRTNVKAIEQKRKYLYNTGFSRSTTLVGDYKNRDTVMVVEGYMDMLKMRQFGIKHVVALLGWKATDQQIAKLKAQGVKTIISALDADECGVKGTNYLKHFFNVVRFRYPPGVKDAGELTRAQFISSNNKTKSALRRQNNEYRKRNQGQGQKVRHKQG